MLTAKLTLTIGAATLNALAILMVMNRIYLNQAAGAYSDREMLMLLLPVGAFALFAALAIRTTITDKDRS